MTWNNYLRYVGVFSYVECLKTIDERRHGVRSLNFDDSRRNSAKIPMQDDPCVEHDPPRRELDHIDRLRTMAHV